MTTQSRASAIVGTIRAARAQLPAAALELACHAAVPVAIDVGLLHLLRVNFFLDPPFMVPHEAEAALLLSPLFREVREDLYEIDPKLRNVLLARLVKEFDAERLARVAILLERYTDQTLAWLEQPELEQAQRLTALSLIDPRRAADWLVEAQAAGSVTPLGREWFVAMADRLRDQAPARGTFDGEFNAVLADLISDWPLARMDAAIRLGQLVQLYGDDEGHARQTLEWLAATDDDIGPVARQVLDRLQWPEAPADAPIHDDASEPMSFLELAGIDDLTGFDPRVAWTLLPPARPFGVPFGVDPDGNLVGLDLRGGDDGGVGTFGLLSGGSEHDRAELLRTLLLGLAVRYSPEKLGMILLDNAHEQTFEALAALPHVRGSWSDLSRRPAEVDAEISAAVHEVYGRADAPGLLLVCNDLDDLLVTRPDLGGLVEWIFRTEPHPVAHLLAAGRFVPPDWLSFEANVSYRLALRTGTVAESMTILGLPDAADLPATPGAGYLSAGGVVARFQAARVSDVLPALVARMAPYRETPHPDWRPELSGQLALGSLLGEVVRDPERGLTVADPKLRGALRVPIGMVDVPPDHRYERLYAELAGDAGHVAIVGRVQSGKSTAIATLIAALALTHTPAEVQVYHAHSGGILPPVLARLPHVGGVFGRRDQDAVRSVAEVLATLLAERERRFDSLGIHDMAQYRRLRATGAVSDDPYGDVFLVIDGWAEVMSNLADVAEVLEDVLLRGLRYGVHIVAAATRWADLGRGMLEHFGTRIELRLTDPVESLISVISAQLVAQHTPGRGLTGQRLHVQIARPALAGGANFDRLVSDVAAARTAGMAPPMPRLPVHLAYADLRRSPDAAGRLALPLGLEEAHQRTLALDFAVEPHLLIIGNAGSGKSSALFAIMSRITERFAPDEATIVLVDNGGRLVGRQPERYLPRGGDPIARLAAAMESRSRRRTGPDWWVLVDDHGTSPAGKQLGALVPYLARAGDLRLHLVLTRQNTSAATATDPVLAGLRELGSAALLLSGSPAESSVAPGARLLRMPPGRGRLVTRYGVRLIQLAYLPIDD